MGYEVINEGTETLIKGTELVVRVHTGPANDGLAYGLGHLYQVKGGFVPVRTYVFEVIGLAETAVEAVKKTMDFFFSVLLDTEWYVKEIPPGSRLFPQEAKHLYGEGIMEEQYGAIDIIRSGWSK